MVGDQPSGITVIEKKIDILIKNYTDLNGVILESVKRNSVKVDITLPGFLLGLFS